MSQLVNERDAAQILGLSIRTLQQWRQSGNGPQFLKIGARAVRYDVDELEAFIAAASRRSTSAHGAAA